MKAKMTRSSLLRSEIDDGIKEILRVYGSYIRVKVAKAVLNEADREELTEEIIIHLYEKLSKMVYNEEGKFEFWLHTVVNNYIVSWLRAKSRRIIFSSIEVEHFPSKYVSLEESFYREKIYMALWKAIRLLDNSQQEILVLHYQKGIHLTQIAEMKGIPYNTLYKKFKKALLLLVDLCNKQGLTVEDYVWLQSHDI